MSYTQDDIDNLEKAIASGVMEVREGSKTVRYQSASEMRETLAAMRREVQGSGASGGRSVARTGRGLR